MRVTADRPQNCNYAPYWNKVSFIHSWSANYVHNDADEKGDGNGDTDDDIDDGDDDDDFDDDDDRVILFATMMVIMMMMMIVTVTG